MFSFISRARKQRVQAALTSRLNQQCLNGIWGAERNTTRSLFIQAVSVVPWGDGDWQYGSPFPAVTANMSAEGIGLIHFEETIGRILIGLDNVDGRVTYISGAIVSTQPLGYGLFLLGFEAKNIVSPDFKQTAEVEAQMEKFGDGTSLSQQALRSLFCNETAPQCRS